MNPIITSIFMITIGQLIGEVIDLILDRLRK